MLLKSRWLLPSVAVGGAVETGYLAFSKLTSSPINSALCFDGAHCTDVLSSPYSQIPFTNIPLVVAGFLGYTAVALVSLSYDRNEKKDGPATLLLGLTSAMASFSAYLMIILFAVLQESCTYCEISAVLSFLIAFIAWNSDIVTNRTKATVVSVCSAAATSLFSIFLFYVTSLSAPEPVTASTAPAAQAIAMMEEKKEKSPPAITKNSSPEALLLAQRLSSLDAKMYGAYWCSHCFNQKQELGAEAFHSLTYIECDKEGKNSQYSLCREKKVPGYPTWEISGELYPGEKTVAELNQLVDKIVAKK